MTFDLIFTIGAILIAGIYLISRLRKKNSGCCGCSGCDNDLKPKPDCACPFHRD